MGDHVPGNPLPRASEAHIDPAKFTAYSMDPSNPGNSGEWEAFASAGYDVRDTPGRRAGAQGMIAQLRQQLITTPAAEGKVSLYGRRYAVRARLRGPNGTKGTLVTIWQIDARSDVPRLITNWLEVIRRQEATGEGTSP